MTNSDMTDRDLSAFRKPASRAGNLSGRLGRSAHAPTEPTPVQAQGTEDDALGTSPLPTTPPSSAAARPSRPADKKASTARDVKSSYSVYLPDDLLDRVATQLDGRTLGEFVLDGYEQVYGDLPQRFRPPSTSASGLPPRTRRPRRSAGTLRERHPRWTEVEFAVLEAQRLELGAPSRSEFVTAVLELYLGSN